MDLSKMFSCVGKKSKQVTRDSSVYDTNGRGLCVIIANFTKCGKKKMELSGYKADIKNIKEIFQNDKRYDFEVMDECKDDAGETMKFYNLSKDQFEKALGLIQKKLNKGWGIQRKQYGKFIMFVLSHGNEEGIQMYQQSVKDRQQYITDEEIIDHFSHDYVPSLKGVPKCFFFQACRGPEETRAANKEMGMGESGKLSTNPLPIITRANILVAHATLDQKRAYVRSCGSLFLRHLANQLKKKDLNLDIFSVLTKVIAEVSEEAMGQDFVCNDDGIVIEVEGEDGFAPTILIGKGKGSNTTEFPLNVSSNQESYDISVLPDDFNFKGDIRVLKKGFEMSCTVPNPGVSAGELDIFASDAFEVEGKLTSKLNPCHFQEGKVKVKDGNILVDGEKLTHGVEVNEMDIVVYKTDKQGKPKEHLCTVEELHQKKTRILIHGKLQGDCTINKVDDVWKAEVGVYQLPVFCSTLTKHLYLTKSVPKRPGVLMHTSDSQKENTGSHEPQLLQDLQSGQLAILKKLEAIGHASNEESPSTSHGMSSDNASPNITPEHGTSDSDTNYPVSETGDPDELKSMPVSSNIEGSVAEKYQSAGTKPTKK